MGVVEAGSIVRPAKIYRKAESTLQVLLEAMLIRS